MKKLLLTLCVAFFSLFGAQAYDDVYLRGDISGSGWPANPNYQFSTTDGVIYTLELDQLYGQFKIADASWSSINYGGAGAIKLDTEYTLTYNSGNISIYGGETWNNVTMTFNLTTKVLKVTGTATANDYDTVYVVGDINGSSWNENLTTYPLSLKSGTSNVWEGSLNITNAASYIKMKAGTLVYGTGGNDINVVSGTPYTASLSGNAFVLGKGEYQINFVLDKNADSGTLTITGEGADIPTNYQSWYVNVVGPFNGWGDNGVNPKEDNISTTENLAIGTQGFKIKVWNTADDIYYIGENPTIPTEQWVQLYVDAYDGSPIQIEGATASSVYTVQYNVETNQVYVTLTSGGTEEPTYPDNMYLIGNFDGENNWNLPGKLMDNEGDGFYTISEVTLAGVSGGDAYFGMTSTDSDDWDVVNANRFGPAEANTEAVVDGENEVTFNCGDKSWIIPAGVYNLYFSYDDKILEIEKVGDYEAPLIVPEAFYIRSSLNEWGDGIEMKKVSDELTDNGEYTYTATVASVPANTEFKITQYSSDWNGIELGAKEGNVNIECGWTVEATNSNSKNFYVNADLNNVTFYLYYNPEGASWVKADCEAAVTYPETVYLMGNVNGGSFAPNYGIGAEGEEGVYNWTEVKIGEGEEFGYINFATVLGTDDKDWDTTGPNSGNRYGAPAENTPITDDTPAEVKLYAVNVSASGCQSWKVEAGTYDIELDLEDMTVTLTAVEEPEPEIPMVPVQATFKFNSYSGMQECYPELTPTKEWDDATGNGSNVRFYIPEDAVLKMGDATITCSKGAGTISPYFYNWNNKTNYDLRTGNKNVLTISMPNGYIINQIVFTAGVTSSDYLKLEPSTGVLQGLTTTRKTWTPTARDGANSVTFTTTGTCAIATIIISADMPTGIEDVEMDSDTTPVFYNLQGVKVQNPENGLYIKVVDGKATKVLVRK